jgi:hypothetical protein
MAVAAKAKRRAGRCADDFALAALAAASETGACGAASVVAVVACCVARLAWKAAKRFASTRAGALESFMPRATARSALVKLCSCARRAPHASQLSAWRIAPSRDAASIICPRATSTMNDVNC